jgi:hypothetical protein
MKQIVVCLLLFLFSPLVIYAQENCQWRDVTGEAAEGGMTVEELGKLAMRRAQLSAIEDVAGVVIYGGSTVMNSKLVGDLVMALSKGYITKKEKPRWEADFQPSYDDKPPIPHYKVHLRCCVSIDRQESDSFFKVFIETNKPVYISEEMVRLKINSSRRAFVTIFHQSDEGIISIPFPDFQNRQCLEEGNDFIFPPEGSGLTAIVNPEKRKSNFFIVVATKEPFNFASQLRGTRDIPLESFYRVLLTIPARERAVGVVGYEVVGKNWRRE